MNKEGFVYNEEPPQEQQEERQPEDLAADV